MAHNIAVVMGVEILNRKLLHFVKHGVAKLFQNALAYKGHKLTVNRS